MSCKSCEELDAELGYISDEEARAVCPEIDAECGPLLVCSFCLSLEDAELLVLDGATVREACEQCAKGRPRA